MTQKSKGSNLLENTFIYLFGTIGSKLSSFLLLPLYSYYLTRNELGIYDVILTTVSLLLPIITLQLSQATYRWLLDVKDYDKRNISIAVSNGFSVISLSNMVFVIIYLLIISFYEIPYEKYFVVILISSSYFIFFHDVSRGLKKNKLYAVMGIINAFCILMLTILFLVVLNRKIEGLLLATVISNIISIIFILLKTRVFKSISFKLFKINISKQMIKYSLPLVPNAISWWLLNAANRYIILYGIGIEANGIYAISARFPAIMTIFNSVFILAWQDHAIQNENDLNFSKKVFNSFLTIELSLAIMLIGCSKYIVTLLISNTFYESWRYMEILFLAAAFSSFASYFGAIYLKEKKTRGIITTTIVGGLINIFISFVFIKEIGLFAPAIGTFAGFLAVYLIRAKQTKPYFPLQYSYKKLTALSLVSIIFLAMSLVDNIYLNVFIMATSIILFGVINYKLLKKMFCILYNMLR